MLNSIPGCLASESDSCNHRIGGSLGPRSGHDILEKERRYCPYRHKISGPSSPWRIRYVEHVTAYGIYKL